MAVAKLYGNFMFNFSVSSHNTFPGFILASAMPAEVPAVTNMGASQALAACIVKLDL